MSPISETEYQKVVKTVSDYRWNMAEITCTVYQVRFGMSMTFLDFEVPSKGVQKSSVTTVFDPHFGK